jgi:hypothetical protein
LGKKPVYCSAVASSILIQTTARECQRHDIMQGFLCSARAGSARAGSARAGSARAGSARAGSARAGSARAGSARAGSAVVMHSVIC